MMNEEKVSAGVEFEIAGKKLRLVLDLWAIHLLKKEFGINAFSFDTLKKIDVSYIIGLIWAMSQLHNPEVTPEWVGRHLELSKLADATKTINEVFQQSFPAKSEVEKKNG